MAEYRVGTLVRSLAGHDKGSYFIIIREAGEYVYLSDGGLRPFERPKKKKKKHVQPSGCTQETLMQAVRDGSSGADQEIRRFIKKWKKEIKQPGGRENVESRRN